LSFIQGSIIPGIIGIGLGVLFSYIVTRDAGIVEKNLSYVGRSCTKMRLTLQQRKTIAETAYAEAEAREKALEQRIDMLERKYLQYLEVLKEVREMKQQMRRAKDLLRRLQGNGEK